MSGDLPEEAATGGAAGNLPVPTRGFVGRRDELTLLDTLLRPNGGNRAHRRQLVTLVGPGGVGKTRLALQAARRAAAAHPDGVWLVELSPLHHTGLTGPAVVGLAVMETLRLSDETTRSVLESLIAWAQGKRLLLVLDSCEHVLTDCAAVVESLLLAPGVHILTTSRRRLGVPGEQCVEVEPLPVGTGRDDALALFADRAAAARPGFTLDGTTRPTAAAICRRLDGIPLAVELAAARLSTLTLQELDDRLGKRPEPGLDLLTAQDDTAQDGTAQNGTAEPRHRTLRTTIGWSHELCAPLERLLWARLSVFAGGFGPDAAQEVGAGGPLSARWVPALLDRLVEQSIVRRQGPARYGMLDTVREYGADWLRELGEEDDVRLRHREYYRRLAREACAEWNTRRQAQWCARVRTDHADFRAAVDWSLDRSEDRAAALEITGAVGFLWRYCGHTRDALPRLDRVLAADPVPGPDLERALWTRGAVALFQGDPDTDALVRRCAEAARRQDDPVFRTAATYIAGGHLAISGRPAEALDVLSTAERLPVRDDWLGAAQLSVLLSVSFAHLMRAEYAPARTVAEEVLEESARRGESWAGTTAAYMLAQADLGQGDVPSAIRNAVRALTGNRLLHDTTVVAVTLDLLANAVAAAGDGHRAARLLGIDERVWDITGSSQRDSPALAAARRACEHGIRATIGDRAYEDAYAEGRSMSYEEGMAYATDAPTG
ncbi:ATP-binding protein [Streptomyces lincolnensis]|uniref:ATP-binding protein n=1 Tax=Streptomyces lincolnensis TaxID=1915 RepID=UPI0037D51369